MKLLEYQAKNFFKKFNISIPEGIVIESQSEIEAKSSAISKYPCVVKAQVYIGGRGKAGGVKIAKTKEEYLTHAQNIISMKIKDLPVKCLLVEEAIDIDLEYYFSIIVDRENKKNLLIFSASGGMDIEEVAEKHPEKVIRVNIEPGAGIPNHTFVQIKRMIAKDDVIYAQVADLISKCYSAYLASDAELLEINPLIITKSGKVIAGDGKMIIDDNGLYRQKDLSIYREGQEDNPIEAEAHKRGITYVKLPGNVGILGNGAGLVMCTLDEVTRAGGKPACFLDIGGGARSELVRNSLEVILLDPEVQGILINVFGGITRCDEVAKGIIEATSKLSIKVPIVIRLTGTAEEEGKKILEGSSLIFQPTMTDAAKKIVSLIGNYTAKP